MTADLEFPDGLRLGRGHRRVPDRGRGHRGRPRAVHLGHLLPYAGQGLRRAHRRRRLRPLPPLPRRRGADGRAGPAAPTGSRWPGRGSSPTAPARSTRAGWTSTTGWSTSCSAAGIDPMRHALPLGPAAGAGGPGRLDRPGHRRALRRVRRRSCTPGSATGSAPGPRSTSRGARRSSATAAACTRPAGSDPAAAFAAAHHLLLGHGLAAPGAARGRRAARVGITLNLAAGRARPTRRTRPTRRRPGSSTACTTGSSSTRCCAGAYPDDVLRARRPGSPTWPIMRDGDEDDHRRADRPAGHQLLHARRTWRRGPARPATPALPGQRGRRVPAAGRPGHRHGLADRAGRPDRAAGAAAPRLPRRAADRSPRTARPSTTAGSTDGRVARPGPDRATSTGTCAPPRRDLPGRRPARLSRLVAAGQLRVGRRLRASASASSTSTTRPSAACPRTARGGIAEVIRRNGLASDGRR